MAPETLTLGLLPEKKRNWRTFLFSYSMCLFLVLLMLVARLIWPDRMNVWGRYTVTEIIPPPDLIPEKPIIKPKPKMKLLPAVKFEKPKLIVPKEIRDPKVQEAKIEPPKIQPVNFEPPKIQPVSGAMPAKVIYTGSFGSSATPTVNAPIEKVQTGGFGDPNGLKPSDNSKPNGKLVAAVAGGFDMPVGPG